MLVIRLLSLSSKCIFLFSQVTPRGEHKGWRRKRLLHVFLFLHASYCGSSVWFQTADESNLRNFISTPRTRPIVPPQRTMSQPYRGPPSSFWGSSGAVFPPQKLGSSSVLSSNCLMTADSFPGAQERKLLPVVSTSVTSGIPFSFCSVSHISLTNLWGYILLLKSPACFWFS